MRLRRGSRRHHRALSLAFGWRLTRASEPFLPLTVLHNPVMRHLRLARDGRLDRTHHPGADLF
jgi:hypothetical protein